MEIGLVFNLDNNCFKNKGICCFFGEMNDLKVLMPNIEKIAYDSNKKLKSMISRKDLPRYEINSKLLNQKISDISSTELKLILLVKAIIAKPQAIILKNFEIGLTNENLKKILALIKSVNETEHIEFIIITNNSLLAYKLGSNIVIMKNKIVKYQGDLLSALKQNLLEKPEIIKFVDLANKKDHSLDYYLDTKDLLKAIYRSVF